MVRTQHFHYQGLGSIPGQGTKIPQARQYSQNNNKQSYKQTYITEKILSNSLHTSRNAMLDNQMRANLIWTPLHSSSCMHSHTSAGVCESHIFSPISAGLYSPTQWQATVSCPFSVWIHEETSDFFISTSLGQYTISCLTSYILISINGEKEWQPTPVFLPRESCGHRGLVGCCP